MEPRLAAGRQATERVELTRQGIGRATESAAALADQLVLEFLVMELTEPPAAQLAKTAGDGAQLQFISSMFDRNPILERLAASVVVQLLGPAMQRNSLHQHEEFDESAIPVENSQHLRLLYQIREVLQRRNTLHQNVQVETSSRTVLSPPPPPPPYPNLPSLYVAPDYHSQLSLAAKTCVRNALCYEKMEGNDITMSVKVYIPSPPPGVKCSYIGRLIGPNGITIRELQLETRCHIRRTWQREHKGKATPMKASSAPPYSQGPFQDSKLFRKMRHKPGFGHLREDTHVLVEAKGTSRAECRTLIEKAKKRIADMFTPEFDSLKREQLIHLAMLNGTYRQSLPSPRSST
ncbi:hypothetical protein COOONC_25169 [Cooperia oncophora]